MKSIKSSITNQVTELSIIPILVFGLFTLLLTSCIIYISIKEEVRYGLSLLAHSFYQIHELQYPGDYASQDGIITKGGIPMNGQNNIVDSIKDISGADTTLFYQDTRLLTTVRNTDGIRISGTHAPDQAIQQVLIEGKEYFSDRISVNGIPYFGFYIPVKNQDGSIVGMMFVGKTHRAVMVSIYKNISFICAAVIIALIITTMISRLYSRHIALSLIKIKEFLGLIANGDMRTEIDPLLLRRCDEIGEMGKLAVKLQKSIFNMVGTDTLTGLYNRHNCNIVLECVIHEYIEKGIPFTIAIGDIDHFKLINDTYGHLAGDQVLIAIASILVTHMEQNGFVFRWGGEEFLFIYKQVEKYTAVMYLRDLQMKLSQSIVCCEGQSISATMTFGLADCHESIQLEELIRIADANLYCGKKQGRNCIICNTRCTDKSHF